MIEVLLIFRCMCGCGVTTNVGRKIKDMMTPSYIYLYLYIYIYIIYMYVYISLLWFAEYNQSTLLLLFRPRHIVVFDSVLPNKTNVQFGTRKDGKGSMQNGKIDRHIFSANIVS